MADQKLIVVTGGAGFIGSHLCARLVKDGHKVISLDNYFTGSRDNHVLGVEYREGHTKNIEKHVPETPDLLYHLGEYSRVEQSVLEPDLVADLNCVGTAGVISFWKQHKCKLVYAGSSTKFGDGGKNREESPYAKTKAENSEKIKEIGDSLRLPYAITYFYNVYGPGERAGTYGTVIEVFKQLYVRGAPLTVTAPGTQKRNFTHVNDIIDGLVLVGGNGTGDEFGLGNEHSFSILDVARLFGTEILLLPERKGNRMLSGLDTNKSHALGWKTKERLEDYIQEFLNAHPRVRSQQPRILVFSTTFFPIAGPAEKALVKLIRQMPDVQFDVITTCFAKGAKEHHSPAPNATIHRMGYGYSFDKYLLPILGFRKAKQLARDRTFLFAWSIFASYAAFAAIRLKRASGLPLLITLADQDIAHILGWKRWFLKQNLADADQVYGVESKDEVEAAKVANKRSLRHSMGEGDAFANQIRFVYSQLLLKERAQ